MPIQLLFIASKILLKSILKTCPSLGYQWARKMHGLKNILLHVSRGISQRAVS